jgi:predicted MFS family arabinose efflux permease
VLAPALAIGASLLFVSSFAEASWQFVAAWALGAAAIGGGLYYNVTMPVTARLFPEHRAAAFSGLTFLGALASPIFYPLAAWFIDMWGWRGALQALVVVMVVCIAPAALLVRAPGAPERGVKPLRSGLSEALRDATVHRALVVFALAAFANSALLLHQVSIMEAMGLSLAAASGFAGARGFFQIPGRVLLTPLTRWFGVRGLVGICYVFAASATFALLLALGAGGTKVLLVYFTVVSGISLGLLSPLNGLFQAEVYGDARIGTLSGVNVIVVSTSGAIGAWVGGLAVDVTGGFEALLVAGAVLQLSAVAALRWQHAAATVLEAEEPENPRRPRIVAPPSRSRA